MHERNATQGLLDKAIQRAAEKHARRITDAYVVMGAHSDYSEESVRFFWAELSKGTAAEEARLHFRKIEAELQCMACFTRYRPVGAAIQCPKCGSNGARVLAGDEFYMEAVDVA
ncbi:MAG: hydrogenase maturation nickel metallochaperone HypA [Anaerolineales bacterium]|jgi:hydrogenase nickel incorporation protein HypA/HybF